MNISKSELITLLGTLEIPIYDAKVPTSKSGQYPYIAIVDYAFDMLIPTKEDYGMKVTYEINLYTKKPREKLLALRNLLKNAVHRDEQIRGFFDAELDRFHYYLYLETVELWENE